ncbi:hypothetical protein [Pseudoxanthomonas putridarboris]|uniref:Uncharacterized protein n=1 Tax=Pseudoxanthomonas putridarboris TaxID=752605 RepID=A0ABU9IY34_9GAMM
MPTPSFKTREDLDGMIAELDGKLETLYRNADNVTRPEIWANLTNATLKLVAPDDQDYAYERLYALFKAHQASSSTPRRTAVEEVPTTG